MFYAADKARQLVFSPPLRYTWRLCRFHTSYGPSAGQRPYGLARSPLRLLISLGTDSGCPLSYEMPRSLVRRAVHCRRTLSPLARLLMRSLISLGTDSGCPLSYEMPRSSSHARQGDKLSNHKKNKQRLHCAIAAYFLKSGNLLSSQALCAKYFHRRRA